jgi:hypothetical protein
MWGLIMTPFVLLSPSAHPGTPIGRRGSPIDATGANNPTSINGRYYTEHALDQMQGRGIIPSVVDDIIFRGTKSFGNTPDTTTHTTEQLKVILNQSGEVVTAITQ